MIDLIYSMEIASATPLFANFTPPHLLVIHPPVVDLGLPVFAIINDNIFVDAFIKSIDQFQFSHYIFR